LIRAPPRAASLARLCRGGRQRQEADAAAKLAITLFQGQPAKTDGRVEDPQSGAYGPAVLLPPTAIFKKDISDVIADGFVKRGTVCAGAYAKLCRRNGIGWPAPPRGPAEVRGAGKIGASAAPPLTAGSPATTVRP
jgi:hypothetical protein